MASSFVSSDDTANNIGYTELLNIAHVAYSKSSNSSTATTTSNNSSSNSAHQIIYEQHRQPQQQLPHPHHHHFLQDFGAEIVNKAFGE